MKKLALIVASATALLTAFAGDVATLPGWSSDFAATRDSAVARHVPMVLVCANQFCNHCQTLTERLQEDDFVTWREASGYEFCYQFRPFSGVDPKVQAAIDFAIAVGGKPASAPYVCLYWVKADGTVVAETFTTEKATAVMSEADRLFADYSTGSKCDFAADGSNEWDRYEAEPGHTEFVDVVLTREGGEAVESGTFEYRYPGESAAHAEPFTWSSATDVRRTFRVPVPLTATKADLGKAISLVARDSKGAVKAMSSILYHCPHNGSNNPLWKDERTLETLGWGEWTADMDTATQKVAQAVGEAWTLVELAGSLWCPDCYRTDVNFLEDGEKVKEWAKARQIALVSVDTPHNSAADPDPENPVGTIWSRDTDATKLIIAPFENADSDKVVRSGKGYLSRKMISDADALVVARENLRLSKDYFHRPEDYATHRTLIPIFILLDKAGRVVGRFETFDARSQSPTTRENTERYLQRFDEMIACAKTAVDPVAEVENNHWSTTPQALAVGGTVSERVSHSDYHDVYRLTGLGSGRVTLNLSGADDVPLSVSLIEVSGDVATVRATQSGTLSQGIALAADVSASRSYYARVFCHQGDDSVAADAAFAATQAASTVHGYSLAAAFEIRPGAIAFDAATQRFYERTGGGNISVTRRDGGSGAASVAVKVLRADASAAGRYEWTNPVLTWADGEQGTKTVPFKVLPNGRFEGTSSVVLQLEAAEGCTAAVSSATETVVIEDSDTPEMERSDYRITVYKNFPVTLDFLVYNLHRAADLSVRRISGSIPSGMKNACDRDVGQLVLTGKPTKTGAWTLVCVPEENRPEGKASGEPVTIGIEVKAPGPLNPYLSKARKDQVIPLFLNAGDRDALVGRLLLSISSAGKISAKFASTESASYLASFSGGWTEFDGATGTAVADLADGSYALRLAMSPDGVVTAQATVPSSKVFLDAGDGPFVTLAGDGAYPQTGVFADYKGYYTVQLPVLQEDPDGYSRGSAFLTLDFTSAANVDKGIVKYAVQLPNGKTLSGTSALSVEKLVDVASGTEVERGRLDILTRSSYGAIGAPLWITPKAADTWKTPEDSFNLPTVAVVDGACAYTISRTDAGDQLAWHEVYGAYFKKNGTPQQLCDLFRLSRDLEFRMSVDDVVSERYGEATDCSSAALRAGSGFDIVSAHGPVKLTSYSKSAGVLSGTAAIRFEGKTVSGNFRAVVMPGWIDCGCGQEIPIRPFAAGTFWFSDYRRIDGESVKFVRSVPVELVEAE